MSQRIRLPVFKSFNDDNIWTSRNPMLIGFLQALDPCFLPVIDSGSGSKDSIGNPRNPVNLAKMVLKTYEGCFDDIFGDCPRLTIFLPPFIARCIISGVTNVFIADSGRCQLMESWIEHSVLLTPYETANLNMKVIATDKESKKILESGHIHTGISAIESVDKFATEQTDIKRGYDIAAILYPDVVHINDSDMCGFRRMIAKLFEFGKIGDATKLFVEAVVDESERDPSKPPRSTHNTVEKIIKDIAKKYKLDAEPVHTRILFSSAPMSHKECIIIRFNELKQPSDKSLTRQNKKNRKSRNRTGQRK